MNMMQCVPCFRTCLMALLIFSCHGLLAQADNLPTVSKKAQKLYDESSEPLNWNRYADAEQLLLKAVAAQPNFVLAYERLGYLYIKTKEFQKSYDAFNKMITIVPDYSREVWYHLAGDALAIQQFDSATAYMAHYRRVGKINQSREDELKLLEQNIAFSKEAVKHPVPFTPVCLDSNVNSDFDEYYPSLTADMEYLYFTRQQKDPETQIRNEDIFYSKNVNGHWTTAAGIKGNVNSPLFNEGAHSISPDGKTLYFTICEMPGGFGGCDIYSSHKVGETWSTPQNLGSKINTGHKETQPCISTDGKTLFFVSDRPGSIGKLDIWMSTLQDNGEWGEAVNPGPDINSAGIDERPYLHPDGETLYFSSDGRPGFGGGDIYFSRKQADGHWGKAENIGFPINSFNYEGGIFVTRDGLTAYYSTNRFTKNGNLDICTFQVPEHARPHSVSYVKGIIFDSSTRKPTSALLEFVDLATGKVANRTVSAAYDGSYLVTLPYGHDYALNILQPGYLLYSQNFSLEHLTTGDIFEKNVTLLPITKDKNVVLNNIFFETGSFQLKKESEIELGKLATFLQSNPSVKIEIGGYTDNMGSATANQELSVNRAKMVLEHLEKLGVAKTRMTAKGYGETLPVAPNASEQGRAKNRRTEFRILDY